MNNKTRSVIKIIAIVLLLLAVVIQLAWVSIPIINPYRFWMVATSAGLLLAISK